MRRFFLALWLLTVPGVALALSSTNYEIPAYDLPQAAGTLSSPNYGLEASLAPVLGTLSSTSYGLTAGFPSVTGGTLTLSLGSATADLGRVSPGSSVTTTTVATVTTDAPSYSLGIQKNQLLTQVGGSTTIADYSGSIASPTAWSGTGFGISVLSGTSVEAKWASGANYAAVPTGTTTTIHTVVGPRTAPDATTVRYRLDAPTNQEAAPYATTVGFVATVLP